MFPSVLQHMTRPVGPRDRTRAPLDESLTIRMADAHEPAIDDLAALEGQSLPAGPSLLAEVGGRPVAALVLSSGVALADPFRPTVAVVEMLRVRARQLGRVC
jgi:hypothetical protein